MQEPVELRTLIYDNTSGAREIAAKSLQFLQRLANQSSAIEPAALWDELADAGIKILRSKPEMAIVFSALNRFLLEAESEPGGDVQEARIFATTRLQDHARRLDDDLGRCAEHGSELVQNGDVVVTFSRSTTVLAALRRAKAQGKLFDVVTAESRPNLEGRILAKELADDQIPVRLVVDALLGSVLGGADRVLVGADAITPTSLVNKAGTRLLGLAAREQEVPLHILADTGKAWVKRTSPTVSLLAGKLREPREVWDQAPHGVEIVNLYFDETPLSWFAGIACELGILEPSAFWDGIRSAGYASRLRHAFGDELT